MPNDPVRDMPMPCVLRGVLFQNPSVRAMLRSGSLTNMLYLFGNFFYKSYIADKKGKEGQGDQENQIKTNFQRRTRLFGEKQVG